MNAYLRLRSFGGGWKSAGVCWGLLAAMVGGLSGAELWVSPSGSDKNPGSEEAPFATVAAAQRKGREMRRLNDPAVAGGVRIRLRGGVYALTTPLRVRPEDSGSEESPTIFEAAAGERPVLSGGVAIGGWSRVEERLVGLPEAAQGRVWVAEAPVFNGRRLEFRQLWSAGRKAIRAREPDGDGMERLLEWDRAGERAWIPAELVAALGAGARVEMVIYQQWAIANLRVKTIRAEGVRAAVTFHDPESRLEFEHPWPGPIMTENYRAPFFLVGALEFLDQPGEWCQDAASGRVIYWPREGEDMAALIVVAPALETVVEVAGSLDRPVTGVAFRGIEFAHTTWMRPALEGHVPLQAGLYLTEAYKLAPKGTPDWRSLDNQDWVGRPPAAVMVKGGQRIHFERCVFAHTGSAGLDVSGGARDGRVEGCVFRDIGGNGVQLGDFQTGASETHLPYAPADDREVCARERIANNVFTDCAAEDWGCVGVAVGYAREVAIEHNELSNLPYTAISLGWGWTRTANAMRDNRVHANHIHRFATRMYDVAGIYTLSAQPGTTITENYLHDVRLGPYVEKPHWGYLYLDEGSSQIAVRDNACPEEKFVKNANGPGNTWERNGPSVGDAIKSSAGLEPAFRDLLEVARPGDLPAR